MDHLIEIGEVVNTHGIRGEIKLNPWTDTLDSLVDFDKFYVKDGDNFYSLKAQSVRIHKNCAIIKLKGIDDMKEAETFRGQVLFVERDENLPEGRYYIKDLIGLTILTEDGPFGTVTDVFQTGANDVYEIKRETGKPVYLPVIKQVIQEVNIPEGFIRVVIPDGLLDD